MSAPSPGAFVALLVFWSACSLLVFAHASRHGNRRATAWGVTAFLLSAFGVLLYFGRFYWNRRRRR